MALIVVRGESVPAVPGEPLIDPAGDIVGMLASADTDDRAFMPMALVEGVSAELEMEGHVQHGWLDIDDATGGGGALVLSVETGGASASVLDPGDVIVSFDGTPVWSPAELDSMLYASFPGTSVSLGVLHQGQLRTATVELAASP
jgi:serine protease Do